MTEPGQQAQDHPPVEVLADATAELLSAQEAAAVRDHLTDCDACRTLVDELHAAAGALQDLPAPPMPQAVLDRLTAVVRAESERRAIGVFEAEAQAEIIEAAKRTALGTFGQNPPVGKTVPVADPHLVRRQTPPICNN